MEEPKDNDTGDTAGSDDVIWRENFGRDSQTVAILDFWISPYFPKNTKLEQKVIKKTTTIEQH